MAASFMIGLLTICCFACIVIAMSQHDEIQELNKRVKPICIHDVDARCDCPDCRYRNLRREKMRYEAEHQQLVRELRNTRQKYYELRITHEDDLKLALSILGFSFTVDEIVMYTQPGTDGHCVTKDYRRVLIAYRDQRMFPIMEWEEYRPGDVNVPS